MSVTSVSASAATKQDTNITKPKKIQLVKEKQEDIFSLFEKVL